MSGNEAPFSNGRGQYKGKVLDFGTPRLYLENPFRLTGLSITTTDRELERKYHKFEMDENLGNGFDLSASLLPMSEPVGWDVLRRARQQLSDPETRLIYELFWFWPGGTTVGADPIKLLAQGRFDDAAEEWVKQEQADSSNIIAIHNLAVLHHARALEPEGSYLTESETARKKYWSGALQRWKLLQDNQSFWDELLDRVKTLDNPRLTHRIVDQIREKLPAALLSINAQISVRMAVDGRKEEAEWQKDLITYSGFGAELVRRSLWSAIAPIQERVESSSQLAIREVEANPRGGKRVITEFLDQMKPYVNAVDCLLSDEDALRIEVHNHIANTALASAVTFGNETNHWITVRDLLIRSLTIGIGADLKQRIQRNLKTVEDRIKDDEYWCDPGYYDLPEGIFHKLELARSYREKGDLDQATNIVRGLLELTIASNLSSEQKSSIYRPIAYCLNRHASDRIAEELERCNAPSSILSAIDVASKTIGQDFTLPNRVAYGVFQRCPHYDSIRGGESYLNVTFNNRTYRLCSSCGSKYKAEKNQRKSALCNIVELYGPDVILALELNPTSDQITENLITLKRIASDAGANLPSVVEVRIRHGLASEQEIIRAATASDRSTRRIARANFHKLDSKSLSRLRIVIWRRRALIGGGCVLASVLLICTLYGLGGYSTAEPGAMLRLYSYGFISQDDAVQKLVESLPTVDGQLATEKEEVLTQINPRWRETKGARNAMPAIFAMLSQDDRHIERRVGEVLREIGSVGDLVVPQLLSMLRDKNPKVRLAAIDMFGTLHEFTDAALPELIERLVFTNDLIEIKELVRALGGIRHDWYKTEKAQTPQAISRIGVQFARLLQDDSIAVNRGREFELDGLGYKSSELLPLLRSALKYTDKSAGDFVRGAIQKVDPLTVRASEKPVEAAPTPLPKSDILTVNPPDAFKKSDDFENVRIAQLKAEIEEERQTLQTSENDLDSKTKTLDSLQSQIDYYAGILDRMDRSRAAGIEVDDVTYNATVNRHNVIVRERNGLLPEYREKQAAYRSLLNELNTKIREYNRLIKSR